MSDFGPTGTFGFELMCFRGPTTSGYVGTAHGETPMPLMLPVLVMPATSITSKFDILLDLLGCEQVGHGQVVVHVCRPKLALR